MNSTQRIGPFRSEEDAMLYQAWHPEAGHLSPDCDENGAWWLL
jgi:hypothetical protein